MIPEEPRPLRKTSLGTQLWGPAGAGVWSSPAIDTKRRVMYVATGNSYTEPAPATTDAIVALDLDSGKTFVEQANCWPMMPPFPTAAPRRRQPSPKRARSIWARTWT
ncbi:MAG: hypothetical protein WDO18_17215 [Acidobacteriota bacterium]